MVDFSHPFQLADEAAAALRTRLGVTRIDVGLVLGSGWSAAADSLGTQIATCDLGELPGFSKPVVAGHGGQARAIRTESGRTALVLTGRTHFYEGRGVAPVVHGVRTMAALGASKVVLTNGCGGLRREWVPGTIVALSDHLNLTGATPLMGATFIDMSEAYSSQLRALVQEVAPGTPEGVYAQFHGPAYETPAEVRMAATLGADLVGMSTALEVIAAREAKLEVLGLSLVTNHAAGIANETLDHAEVIAAGQAAAPKLQSLLQALIGRL
ncbi:MAG: purine-nucleoside phosphorylase [Propionibacteriaceae bacterium]